MRARAEGLRRNLAAGMRLALFLRVRPFDYRASPADLAVLLACNFAVWVAVAALRTGFAPEFDDTAIAVFLASVPLVLAAAAIIAAWSGHRERLMLLATALVASDPVFELGTIVLPEVLALIGYPRLTVLFLLAWIWAVAVRAVVVCIGGQRVQHFRGALVVTALIGVGFFALPRTEVWYEPETTAPREPLAGERLFHLQGQLIEQALAAIRTGRPGVPELYFVGFAPDASQDVFLKELRFVRRLFDERFATAGRSIALASSQDALDELPIGSVSNLERSLARVGAAMNADEDTLFLYITAHGTPEHRLSAEQPPLELASLTPTALARMLQQAGIKWRVLVVSACYSGGFIEPLRDDNTVIITAAAPDRTSFGCEPGREFTYFGDAYFRHALARSRSFTEAFPIAKEAVARQEAAEGLTPSLPQMWVGRSIAERLKHATERPDEEGQQEARR